MNTPEQTVLCPLGHIVTASPLGRDFAGSFLEAKIVAHQRGGSQWVVKCEGAALATLTEKENAR